MANSLARTAADDGAVVTSVAASHTRYLRPGYRGAIIAGALVNLPRQVELEGWGTVTVAQTWILPVSRLTDEDVRLAGYRTVNHVHRSRKDLRKTETVTILLLQLRSQVLLEEG